MSPFKLTTPDNHLFYTFSILTDYLNTIKKYKIWTTNKMKPMIKMYLFSLLIIPFLYFKKAEFIPIIIPYKMI